MGYHNFDLQKAFAKGMEDKDFLDRTKKRGHKPHFVKHTWHACSSGHPFGRVSHDPFDLKA